MGECWHNNHHAFPGSARLGLRVDEWDPGWWMLLALRRTGLVWKLRLPEDLAFRAELVEIPGAERHSSPGLVDVMGMLLMPARLEQSELTWPGRRIAHATMRRLVRSNVDLKLDGNTKRLTLRTVEGTLCGLPAMCVAVFGHRSFPARFAATLLAPIAVMLEFRRCQCA